MAKTNYGFEKRQRDIAKKQKQEEKRRKKMENQTKNTDEGSEHPVDDAGAAPGDADGLGD